ncbi:MAG TPA: hypothetical protein VIH86_00640 [Puia sp.]
MKNFLNLFGLSLINIINGAIGGVVWSVYKKSDLFEAIRQIFIGGLVSAYVTPIIGNKMNSYTAFLSFTVGMVGMVAVDIIYKWAVRKIKLIF